MSQVMVSGEPFDINSGYEAKVVVGQGGFGLVLAVSDSNGCHFAIKKVGDAFADCVDGKRLLREILVMKHLCHPNILSLEHMYMNDKLNSVYIVSVLMDSNLKKVIEKDLRKLTLKHLKFIMYQILCGLKYIHACGLIHR
jgi:mitogen-activated protein kinase 1/3